MRPSLFDFVQISPSGTVERIREVEREPLSTRPSACGLPTEEHDEWHMGLLDQPCSTGNNAPR